MMGHLTRRAGHALAAVFVAAILALGFAAPIEPAAAAASYLVDNVKMTVSGTPGTGTITLGSAVTGAMSASTAGVPNGSQVSYYISDGGSNWEIGQGTYSTTGPTLTRGALWSSAGANTAISLDSSALVSLTLLAEDIPQAIASSVPTYASGFVNKFRNGTFDIWQLGTSGLATSTSAPGNYTADGFQVQQTGAVGSCQRAAIGLSGLPLYGLECNGATSNTDTKITAKIGSFIAAPLAGQTVTVQVRYTQDSGAAVTPKVSSAYASAQDNFSTVTGDLGSTPLSSCASGVWCIEAYTFNVSANATNGYEIVFDCNVALTAAQECSIAAADIRVTPNLTAGAIPSNPPTPEMRPVWLELPFDLAYFETSYPLGIAPGTASETATARSNVALNTTDFYDLGETVFKTKKQCANPTITFYNPSTGAPGSFWDLSSSSSVGAASTRFVTSDGFNAYSTTATLTAVNITQYHWTASCVL